MNNLKMFLARVDHFLANRQDSCAPHLLSKPEDLRKELNNIYLDFFGGIFYKVPKWTVGTNIVSLESNEYVGKCWEFFDKEEDAIKCYNRQVNAGNIPFRRPFHNSDYVHLHCLLKEYNRNS